jgi:hypothetical protein
LKSVENSRKERRQRSKATDEGGWENKRRRKPRSTPDGGEGHEVDQGYLFPPQVEKENPSGSSTPTLIPSTKKEELGCGGWRKGENGKLTESLAMKGINS